MDLSISEIFYSLQGEGVYSGLPTVFIRFQGCNLMPRCSYCDTVYAQDGSEGTLMDIEEVLEKVQTYSPHYKSWICITGGEPLFQLDALCELVKRLKSYGYSVEVETNGSIRKPIWWTRVDSWVADIKCPSSGVCGVSLIDDWFNTRSTDQVKFVVGTKEDLDFTRKEIYKNVAKNPVVLVGPVMTRQLHEREWLQEVAEFCKEEKVRYNLQLHRIIYGNKKGV